MTAAGESADVTPPPPRRIGLRLAYEGTRYSGWQVQPGRTTVQGVVAEAVRAVSGEEVLVRGSSRTDAGVHALDQIAAFTTHRDLAADVWMRALNAKLPADVKGEGYPSETFRVLKEKEIRHHGEYRTRRLVLAAWDRMEANGEFTAMGM